jgi:excisionase family DNA binding protein
MNSFEKMYSVKETADALGFSVDTIRRRIRSKKLKAFKLPSDGPNEVYRIGKEEIEAFKRRNIE